MVLKAVKELVVVRVYKEFKATDHKELKVVLDLLDLVLGRKAIKVPKELLALKDYREHREHREDKDQVHKERLGLRASLGHKVLKDP